MVFILVFLASRLPGSVGIAKRGNRMPKQLSISGEIERSLPYSAMRRSLLAGAGALVAGVGLAGAVGAQTSMAKTSPSKSPHQAVVEATKRCETVGNACLRHCQRLTRLGDKSLADCMRSVSAMLPVCVAMNRLATQDAKRLKDLAKVCADICRDCEAECRKHEFHHVECKRCAEACAATVKVLTEL
jgi:Cys-rich four helix bundle protein (predicted Tat secretion target)